MNNNDNDPLVLPSELTPDDGWYEPEWLKLPPTRNERVTRIKRKRAKETTHWWRLSQTEEGRAQMREWQAKRLKGNGRKPGSRDGWTQAMLKKDRERALGEAKIIVEKLMEKHPIDDAYAKEAMEVTVQLMRQESIATKDKLAAARTVLEWTKEKPAQKNSVTVQKAEDFLADVLKMENDVRK